MADPTVAVGLLERAIGYARGSVAVVTPPLLSRPTPCAGWDLRMLLDHLNDSLGALHDIVHSGRIGLSAPPAGGRGPAEHAAADLVATFRDRLGRLLGVWAGTGAGDHLLAVGGLPLAASLVAGTGAVEIAVHAWDVSSACGHRRPIPPALATDLLRFSRLVVTDATRHPQFAAPVAVSPLASPSDRLVAFLGRSPAP